MDILSIDETIQQLQQIGARTTGDTERVALRSAIDHLYGIQREMREKALRTAVELCQGRYKNDYTDAYDADTIVKQADFFYGFAETGTTE